jgi:Rieske Fe-S protein
VWVPRGLRYSPPAGAAPAASPAAVGPTASLAVGTMGMPVTGAPPDPLVRRQSGGHGDATGGGGSDRTSGKKTGGRAEKQALHRRAIAQVAEMRPGTAMKFQDSGGNPAVLVRLKRGNFVAYSAICTHEGCTVAFRNGQLACPCHGSIFDPANNARVVNGPAQRPLPKMPVEVRGGEVVRA